MDINFHIVLKFCIVILIWIHITNALNTYEMVNTSFWRSTSEFKPIASRSYGTIQLLTSLRMEFNLIFYGRNDQNNWQNIFRIGYKSLNNSCYGYGSRYPSLWLTENIDDLHLGLSQEDNCHYGAWDNYPIQKNVIYSIIIEFNDTWVYMKVNNDIHINEERQSQTLSHIHNQHLNVWISTDKTVPATDVLNMTLSNITILTWNASNIMMATLNPIRNPTQNPTNVPTTNPTKATTKNPTKYPTKYPTNDPTQTSTDIITNNPSIYPTDQPSGSPTAGPRNLPSIYQSLSPTMDPIIDTTSFSTISPKPPLTATAEMVTTLESTEERTKAVTEMNATTLLIEPDGNDMHHGHSTFSTQNIYFLVIGALIASIICVCIIGGLLLCVCCKWRKRRKLKYTKPPNTKIEPIQFKESVSISSYQFHVKQNCVTHKGLLYNDANKKMAASIYEHQTKGECRDCTTSDSEEEGELDQQKLDDVEGSPDREVLDVVNQQILSMEETFVGMLNDANAVNAIILNDVIHEMDTAGQEPSEIDDADNNNIADSNIDGNNIDDNNNTHNK